MARTLESTPQLRAVYALSQARKSRHHKDCFCRHFDRLYCNAADAMWSTKVDNALAEYRKARDANHG